MKGGNKLFLFAGVGLAIVAVLLGITMSSGGDGDGNSTDAKQQEAPSKVTVVRLLQDVEQHTVIKADMVEQVEVDATAASPDAVTSPAEVVNQSYTLKASVGDIMLKSYVAPPGITASIEPGYRAVSLSVDAQGSMAGLVVAGDYIDVVFEARVDLNRILDFQGLEFYEDEYYRITNESDSNDDSNGDSSAGSDDEEDQQSGFQALGIEPSPYQGTDGSIFTATDGGDFLEPVAKMLVQDVKILRVIGPGERYDAQGQPVAAPEEGGPAEDELGQLILQVSPQQAEAIAFMQSEHHTYSIAVRGKDDHSIAQTTGITFEILMSDGTWSLPWPQALEAETAREQRGTPGTPVADTGDEDDEDS